jgi:hypothetical protein
LPLHFQIALQYALRKIQENQVGLHLNEIYHLLPYANDVDVMGDNTETIKKKKGTLIDVIKEDGPELNTEKAMTMLLYHHRNAGQHHDIETGNR